MFACFVRCKALPSTANEALQTLQSVSCSFLCIITMLLQCKTLQSIANEALQTLQSVVHFSVFYHAFCSTKDSRAYQMRPCKPYSSVVHFSVFYSASCSANHSRAYQRRRCNPYCLLFTVLDAIVHRVTRY